MKSPVDLNQLRKFLQKAASETYASGGKEEENPERAGCIEFIYEEGDLLYRDSYTGYIRSRGTEIIRYKNIPVWTALYGGGMVEGKEDLAHKTFDFLKKAFLSRDENSVRGPKELTDGDWRYSYRQDGDLDEFSGYEEIYYQEELVFFHRIIGGFIIK